jgi:cathepsin B
MVNLEIYEDLFSYGGGIYRHTAGDIVGGHAWRVVGWGHDEDGDGSMFWIAQNQWTEEWGESGYIRLLTGEIGVDNWAVSCMPDF